MRVARNVAIVLALAAVLDFAPGGGTAGGFVVSLLSVVFLASLAWFAAVMYRQNRIALLSLEPPLRLLLYASAAVAVITVIATDRLWRGSGGLGVLVWFALIAGASIGMATVYRAYRRY